MLIWGGVPTLDCLEPQGMSSDAVPRKIIQGFSCVEGLGAALPKGPRYPNKGCLEFPCQKS